MTLPWVDRAALLRAPAGVHPTAAVRTTGLMFVGGGLLALVSTVLADAPVDGIDTIRLLGLAAFAVGGWALVDGTRWGAWTHHTLLIAAWAMITVGVSVAGGGTPALAIAMLYLLVVVNVFTLVSWLSATAHLLLAVGGVVGAVGTAPGIGAAATALCAGTVVLVGLFAGRLVRATAEAQVDPLTRLLNRRCLDQRMDEALRRAERHGEPLTGAVLDLDHFKAVNDRHGHVAGDRLLVAFARAARSALPRDVIVARTGGDEFVLLAGGRTTADVGVMIDGMRAALPDGCTCTAGTAQWEPGDSGSLLVSRADTALCGAKRSRRGTTRAHAATVDGALGLRRAVARGELEVHYQPVVDLGSGAIVAAEALVRWRHPERGLIPPDQFIPQAERSGAILDVGHLVLRRALADAARWPAGPHGRRRVAVNVSGPELADPRYLGRVHEALRRSGLPADVLILEITEGLLDVESDVVVQTLRHLRSQGVRVAMDDFGTGYSSLARLGRLDLDLLKVDRSFVSTIRTASSDAPLVSSILALAAALDLTVVAEGVETPEQAAWLRDRGCQEGQGHLWSRAVPADEVGVLMTARAGGSVPHPRRDDADADTDDAALPAALEPA